MTTVAALRSACLALPGAQETFPFGPQTMVFKVGGKMFALVPQDATPPTMSVKCDPDLAAQLRETHEQVRPGYHLDKRHWNTVVCDGTLPDRFLRELLEDSYDLVVAKLPKRVQRELDWPGLAG